MASGFSFRKVDTESESSVSKASRHPLPPRKSCFCVICVPVYMLILFSWISMRQACLIDGKTVVVHCQPLFHRATSPTSSGHSPLPSPQGRGEGGSSIIPNGAFSAGFKGKKAAHVLPQDLGIGLIQLGSDRDVALVAGVIASELFDETFLFTERISFELH